MSRPDLHLPPAPPGFRGRFQTGEDARITAAGASGPFWHLPAALALPRDADDVERLVEWALRNHVPLVPRGGGTGMPGGNVSPWVTVDLRGLDEVGAVERLPDGRRAIRAGAGATAARIRDTAESLASGHTLPALPSSAPWCTAGGVVACNGAGARSLRHGAARSWTHALEWIRGDGTREVLTRSGAGSEPGSGSPRPGDVRPGTMDYGTMDRSTVDRSPVDRSTMGREITGPWDALRREMADALPAPLPWPRVRKNSSGYALDHFLETGDGIDLAVGSEGTLGIVTEATWVLAPVPPVTAVALLGLTELARLPGLAGEIRTLGTVTACEYLGRRLVEMGGLAAEPVTAGLATEGGLLLVELAGASGEVDDDLARVEAWGRDGGVRTARDPADQHRLWEIRHAANPTLARALEEGKRSTQFIEDSVVPVEALDTYVRDLTAILDRHGTDAVLFGHAGDGNLHVNPLVDLGDPGWRTRVRAILDETVTLVADLGGTLAGEHGDGRLRTPFLDRIFHPAVVEAFATVKGRLDPSGILNPGVVVPAQGWTDPLAGLGDAPGFSAGSQGPERGHR